MEGETTPNISSMSDEDLREPIDRLTAEEQDVSYRRRILHGLGKTEPPTKPPS